MAHSGSQAAGKCTRDEADAFIDQLKDAEEVGGSGPAAPPPRLSAAERALRAIPDHQLAAELQRRGWIVVEP